MKIFNLAKELEKERKKNKELEKEIQYFKKTITFKNYVKEVNTLINYKKRCELAIEYIEKYCEDYVIEDSPDEMCLFYNENGSYKPEAKKDLLNILKGSDNNE